MKKKIIKENIKADLFRVCPGDFSYKKLIYGFKSKGFKYLFFLRLTLYTNPLVRTTSKILVRFLGYRYGFQIPRHTSIGGGLFIGHFGTVVISQNAIIGSNCNIAHNCTIGAARGKRKGAPKIGQKVWIGTGSVIVGDIIIEDNVMIAPNSFVNFDVPSHSLVLGNPGQIISKSNPTKGYINNAYYN